MAQHATARVLILLTLAWLVTGCSPLLPLLGAALGGPDGKSQLTGPFAGAPSAIQNRRPADSPISDAVASAEQNVRQSCIARLPPEPTPGTGCAMRSSCLPGSEQPIRLRLCAGEISTVFPETTMAVASDWHWAEDTKPTTP